MPKLGEIVDSIQITNTPGESFALYLPKSFDAKTASPVLFVFDSAARGRVGITPFVESSEKYGIILICSNNSKNGPYEKNFSVANNLFNHVLKNYTVDSGQMFLSGFSGGSRLAAAIASLSNQFRGVIACGAGFSPMPSHTPSTQDFLYAAICGIEDMNYLEIVNNDQYLERLHFKHTVISFDGGHQWPPMEQIAHAFDWMFLNIKKGTGPLRKGASLKEPFSKDLDRALNYKRIGKYLLASEYYRRLLDSYPKTLVPDSLRNNYEALMASKEYRMAHKQRTTVLELEKRTKDKIFSRLKSDLNDLKNMNWKWWSKELSRLSELKAKGNTEEQYMVSRVRFALMAFLYENKMMDSGLASDEVYNKMFQRFRKLVFPKTSSSP